MDRDVTHEEADSVAAAGHVELGQGAARAPAIDRELLRWAANSHPPDRDDGSVASR